MTDDYKFVTCEGGLYRFTAKRWKRFLLALASGQETANFLTLGTYLGPVTNISDFSSEDAQNELYPEMVANGGLK